jgi:hypothetical protein
MSGSLVRLRIEDEPESAEHYYPESHRTQKEMYASCAGVRCCAWRWGSGKMRCLGNGNEPFAGLGASRCARLPHT